VKMQNNRHTFQSWRDRWIKNLSTRPRHALIEADEEDEDADDPSADDGPKFRQPVRKQHAPQVDNAHRDTSESSSPSRTSQSRGIMERKPVRKPSPYSSPAKPTAGNSFTDEDTELLDDNYEDIINLAEDQIIDAWITWAESVSLLLTR
jgi:hypothetical protein